MENKTIQRLISSRKLWGALLGSLCIMALVRLTPPESLISVITVVGGLWSLAIGGQALKDYKQTKQ
mgnify:CR=1 FL=1